MPRNEIGLESALFEDLEECEGQRPRSWVHYPARAVGRVALVHNMPLPFRTHWDGHRDVFCIGRQLGCEMCKMGRGFKGHYAFAVWDMVRRQHGGFDFTASACRQLMDSEYSAESRCGFVFTIRKEGGKDQGRFVIEGTGMCLPLCELGEPCDIVALVCETYKIERSHLNPEFVAGLGYSRELTIGVPSRVNPAPHARVE